MNRNTPETIGRIAAEERALAILRLISHKLHHRANTSVLSRCLEIYGLRCGHDELLAQLQGLERTGLVNLERNDALTVVSITRKGAEAGDGLIEVDGVARCPPECPY